MTSNISNAEREVMEVLWEKSPLSAQEVIDAISLQNGWQEKTVKTLLNRLLKKEILAYKKEKRKYLYYPTVSRKKYVSLESKNFLERFFGGKISPMISSFAEQKLLGKKEVEELKQLLDKMD